MPPLPGRQGTLNRKQEYPGLLDALTCTQHLFWVDWAASALAELSTHQPSPRIPSGALLKPGEKLPAKASHGQPQGLLHWCSACVSQGLGTTRCTMLTLLFSPEGKRENDQQGTIGFPLLRFSISCARGTPLEN